MILDTFSNIKSYKDLSKDIFAGLVFLEKAKRNISLGVYTINDRVKAIVEEYETIQQYNFDFESHKYVVDIQYPIIGLERVLWSPIKDMKIKTPYDRKKDCSYFTNPHDQATQVDIGNKIFAQQPFKNIRVTMCGRYLLPGGPAGATKILRGLSGCPSIDDNEVSRHVNQLFGYPVVDIVQHHDHVFPHQCVFQRLELRQGVILCDPTPFGHECAQHFVRERAFDFLLQQRLHFYSKCASISFSS